MTSKKKLSERDICTQFIIPALRKSGWDVSRQVREEVFFTDGRIFVKGDKAARGNIPHRILSAMQAGRAYSRADLLAATGIGEAEWVWAIRQLKEERKVAQAGEKRGARYIAQ